jgi:hypothetical protein
MGKTNWTEEKLRFLNEALKDLGPTEECARFLMESLPDIGPRSILNQAMRTSIKLDPGFRNLLLTSVTGWLNKKWNGRLIIDGQVWVGISRLRTYLESKCTAGQLERAGLWPLPGAEGLRGWLKEQLQLEGKAANGHVVYPLDPVMAHLRRRRVAVLPESEDELIARALEAKRAKLIASFNEAQAELHRVQELRNAAYAKFEQADLALRNFETKIKALQD